MALDVDLDVGMDNNVGVDNNVVNDYTDALA
jgi:hypothetical protein